MPAKDYKICPALTCAFIAKTSKRNPNLMLEDRREITEQEILALIDWYVCNRASEGFTMKSLIEKGKTVYVTLIDTEEEKDEADS